MSKLEGTDSKPRNQILDTPKNSEASEKKSSEADDSKSRNQILETPSGNDSSEKDEKVDRKDDNEGTKSGSDKDKRPIRERVSDFFKKFKENDDKKKTSETDNKPESKKETSEDKKSEFDFSWGTSQRGETKTNDVPDKKKNNETGNSSDDSDSPHGHADREIGDDKPYNAQPETKNRDSREQSNEQQRETDKKKVANLKDNEQVLNLHNIDAINRNNEAAENEKKKNRQNRDWEIGD